MKSNIKNNVLLSKHTTFKVGGKAKYYVEVKNKSELRQVVKFSKSKKIPIFVLGGGSDILISDKGFPGLVLKYTDASLELSDGKNKVSVTAGAGMMWDDLVSICVQKGLQGIECLSGIPGSVRAAPIQNIGAYGQELKNTLVELIAFNILNNTFVNFDKKQCKFSYRSSVFKDPSHWQKYLILNVTLKLKKDGKPVISYESLANYLKSQKIKNPTLSEVRESVLNVRKTRFENYKDVPNAGSFFKNPIIDEKKLLELKKHFPDIPCYKNTERSYKCYAGWLVEKSGWKGKRYGNAAVSSKHALVLINPQRRAKANEIKILASKITNDVYKKFRIKLEPEVQYIGF